MSADSPATTNDMEKSTDSDGFVQINTGDTGSDDIKSPDTPPERALDDPPPPRPDDMDDDDGAASDLEDGLEDEYAFQRMRRKLQEANAESTKLRLELLALRDGYSKEEFNTMKSKLEREVSHLNMKVNALKKKQSVADVARKKSIADLADLESRTSASRSEETTRYQAMISSLEGEISELKIESQKELAELQDDMGRLKTRHEREIRRLQEAHDLEKNNIASRHASEISTLKNSLKELRSSMSSDVTVRNLQERCMEYEERIQILQKEHDDDIEKLVEEHEKEFRTEQSAKEIELESLQNDVRMLRAQNRKLRDANMDTVRSKSVNFDEEHNDVHEIEALPLNDDGNAPPPPPETSTPKRKIVRSHTRKGSVVISHNELGQTEMTFVPDELASQLLPEPSPSPYPEQSLSPLSTPQPPNHHGNGTAPPLLMPTDDPKSPESVSPLTPVLRNTSSDLYDKEKDELVERVTTLKRQNDNLNDENERLAVERDRLRNRVARFEKQLTAAAADKDSNEDAIATIRAEYETELKSQRKAMGKVKQKFTMQLESVELDLNQARKENRKLKDRIDTLNETITSLDNNVSILEERANHGKADQTDNEMRIAELEGIVEDYERELEEFESSMETLTNRLTAVQNENAILKGEMPEQDDLALIHASLSQEHGDDFTSQIVADEVENDPVMANTAVVSDVPASFDVESHENELNNMRELVGTLRSEMSSLRSQYKTVVAERDEMKREMDARQQALGTIEEENFALRDNIARVARDNKLVQNELHHARSDSIILEERNKDLIRQLQRNTQYIEELEPKLQASDEAEFANIVTRDERAQTVVIRDDPPMDDDDDDQNEGQRPISPLQGPETEEERIKKEKEIEEKIQKVRRETEELVRDQIAQEMQQHLHGERTRAASEMDTARSVWHLRMKEKNDLLLEKTRHIENLEERIETRETELSELAKSKMRLVESFNNEMERMREYIRGARRVERSELVRLGDRAEQSAFF